MTPLDEMDFVTNILPTIGKHADLMKYELEGDSDIESIQMKWHEKVAHNTHQRKSNVHICSKRYTQNNIEDIISGLWMRSAVLKLSMNIKLIQYVTE